MSDIPDDRKHLPTLVLNKRRDVWGTGPDEPAYDGDEDYNEDIQEGGRSDDGPDSSLEFDFEDDAELDESGLPPLRIFEGEGANTTYADQMVSDLAGPHADEYVGEGEAMGSDTEITDDEMFGEYDPGMAVLDDAGIPGVDDDEDQISQHGGHMDFEDDTYEEGDADSEEENMIRLIDGDASRTELAKMHPLIVVPTDDEMSAVALVVRNQDGQIIDDNHGRTHPWISRFELAAVLGMRAEQLSHGAPPQIELQEGVIDSMEIARMELEEKQIPFVIRRPLPDGEGSEYWPVHELMVLD
jgi:DNA-directed RNA polymerase I, II, and III subunit RPABC2